jgi:asparagine synthase (glutamine-hydrolysing)
MCGITALVRYGDREIAASTVAAMTELVHHRGPDGSGVELFAHDGDRFRITTPDDPAWRVALGHRRLSILDLSPAGRQPMSCRERYWITFNGEIYNFVELRAELQTLGRTFTTGTDTEVALAAFAEWGPECFARFRGMWGIVIVDLHEGAAYASRDRLGIKPLYWTRHDGVLAFVSEIKQLQALPGYRFRAHTEALWEYILTGDEETDRTLFAGVEPIAGGTWRKIDLATGDIGPAVPFWFPERIRPEVDDADTAARLFREALFDATRVHLRSDVPVGCALSGGLDSSALAACTTKLLGDGGDPLHTFSVVFPGHPRDESMYVRSVVERTHARSHTVTPTPEALLADLDRFVWIHDEPVGGLAQYAAYAVARLTRETAVPVTLNGQGGDEVLGGYWQSYFVYLRKQLVQGRLLRVGSHLVGAMTPAGNAEMLRQIPVILKRYRHRKSAGTRWRVRDEAAAASGAARRKLERVMSLDDQQRRVFEMREVHLPRLLKWDDRNFMAFAIEGRYPFLDHPLIETALAFKPELLYSRGWSKEPLRRAIVDLLPADIVRRRTKFGFPTPQVDWVLGPLRATLEAFVADDSPLWDVVDRRQAAEFAERVWSDAGRHDNLPYELFRLFLLDRWLRRFDIQLN